MEEIETIGFPIEIYVIHAIHGLVYGMLLFLVVSGSTLVISIMGVVNLTHAGLYILSAYLTYSIVFWTNSLWFCFLIVHFFVGIAGVFVERFPLRKVHIYGHNPCFGISIYIMAQHISGIPLLTTNLIEYIHKQYNRG